MRHNRKIEDISQDVIRISAQHPQIPEWCPIIGEIKINTDDVQMTEQARKAGLESIFKDIADNGKKFGNMILIDSQIKDGKIIREFLSNDDDHDPVLWKITGTTFDKQGILAIPRRWFFCQNCKKEFEVPEGNHPENGVKSFNCPGCGMIFVWG